MSFTKQTQKHISKIIDYIFLLNKYNKYNHMTDAQLVPNLAQIVYNIQKQLTIQNKHIKPYSSDNNITGAGGIIYDSKNNKLLVVKGPEKWSLPKGHKEIGEETYETAMREIFEETSIKVSLSMKCKYTRILKCIYYWINVTNGEQLKLYPIDINEVSDIRWCTKDQLINLSCNKQLKYFIKNWGKMLYVYNKYGDKLKYAIDIATHDEIEKVRNKFQSNQEIHNY